MPRTISKPGPPPTSCHTCRRRRKKCDRSKPHCERCLKGGYECLGYGNGESPPSARQQEFTVVTCSSRPVSLGVSTELARLEAPGPPTTGKVEDRRGLIDAKTNYNHRLSVLGSALSYRMNRFVSLADGDRARASAGPLEAFDRIWPQEQSQSAAHFQPRSRQPSRSRQLSVNKAIGVRLTRDDLSRVVRALCRYLPRSVDATKTMRADYVVNVVNEYLSQRVVYWFTTPPPVIRKHLANQLKESKRMMWIIYLGAKIFQALGQVPQACDATVQCCMRWIDDFERIFATVPYTNLPLSDIEDCLGAQLGLAFLKFTVVDSSSGYALFQKAVPMFLQLVATDNLHMEQPDGSLVVSFRRTLGALRYDLRRFVEYDTVVTLLLGVLPFIEYGYDGEPDGIEWSHGFPFALLEVISHINSWRAGSKVPLDDWQTLESRVLAWQPLSTFLDENSATDVDNVARVAVQESWRHVALIYIYMARCGVSSHDSRVQASVHRIVQLGATAAKFPFLIHMFVQCVIAGLAARLEEHRVAIYQMLVPYKDSRAWLSRGPQFSQVLYHLWRGVGEGGAPVTWDDYIQSRCAVLPI